MCRGPGAPFLGRFEASGESRIVGVDACPRTGGSVSSGWQPRPRAHDSRGGNGEHSGCIQSEVVAEERHAPTNVSNRSIWLPGGKQNKAYRVGGPGWQEQRQNWRGVTVMSPGRWWHLEQE